MTSTTTLPHLPGFLDDVLHQAEWRAQKASEFPDDERNANAAAHLEALHAWLAHEAGDLDLRRLDEALGKLYADPDVNSAFQPGVTDRLGRFGFHHSRIAIPLTFMADVEELIEAILAHVEPKSEETVEGRILAAATDYAETIKELLEEYLEEKRLAFNEEVEDEEDDDLAEQWKERLADEERNFFELVKEAEADAWR